MLEVTVLSVENATMDACAVALVGRDVNGNPVQISFAPSAWMKLVEDVGGDIGTDAWRELAPSLVEDNTPESRVRRAHRELGHVQHRLDAITDDLGMYLDSQDSTRKSGEGA